MQIIPPLQPAKKPFYQKISESLAWTPSSYGLLSFLCVAIALVVIVWWPLVQDYLGTIDPAFPLWQQIDWLLVGIFLAMSLLILFGANFNPDSRIVVVGLAGGLVIETWGTQTHLWNYYTLERPPLWIIPAWPIASLATDRLARLLSILVESIHLARSSSHLLARLFRFLRFECLSRLVFGGFFVFMIAFVWPTITKPATWLSLATAGILILAIKDHRKALLIFIAGSGLGYFLELWGTTRACWIYYNFQTPPLFAVFAHGFASYAFYRSGILLAQVKRILCQPG